MTHPTDAAIAQAFRERLESMYSPLTVREVMKAVETRARELDAAKPEQVHTCSYYCDRPGCLKDQRDELRDRLEATPPAQAAEAVERVARALAKHHGQDPDGTLTNTGPWWPRDRVWKVYEDEARAALAVIADAQGEGK